MQWTPPPPRASTVADTATPRGPGRARRAARAPSASVSAPVTGTISAPLHDVVVHVRDHGRRRRRRRGAAARQLDDLEAGRARAARRSRGSAREVRVGLVGDGLQQHLAGLDRRRRCCRRGRRCRRPRPGRARARRRARRRASSRSRASISLARRAPGCGCGCSRHCSVVISVPSPSTAIEPPSRIRSVRVDGAPPPGARARARRTRASSSHGANFSPQALKPKSTPARRAVAVEHEDRPGVAQPRVVDRQLDHLDVAAARRRAPRPPRRVGDHRDRLEGGDRVGDRGVLGLARRRSAPATSSRAPAST